LIATVRPPAPERPRFAGIPLDILSMDATLANLERLVESGRSNQVATVNIDFVVRAQRDPWLKAILNRTAMNLVDGTPLVWALRTLGHPVPERVAGSDLIPRLLGRIAPTRHSVYLLGGTPSVAKAAVQRIRARYPGLQMAGVDTPPSRPVEGIDAETVGRIRRARPSLLLVAFGNPKQEFWLDLHLAETEVPLALGIGGTVDFLAGRRRRAPRWMQRCGLEWTVRLAQEPARLGPRYLRDSVGFARLLMRHHLAPGGLHG